MTPIPADFKKQLTEGDIEWARSKGFSDQQIVEQTDRFLNHARVTERRLKNWRLAWTNWMTRAQRMGY